MKKKIYRYKFCLAYAVVGMFYSVVGNQRRLNTHFPVNSNVSAHRGQRRGYRNIASRTHSSVKQVDLLSFTPPCISIICCTSQKLWYTPIIDLMASV